MKTKWSSVAPIHWLNPEMLPVSQINFYNGVILSSVSSWTSKYQMPLEDFPEDLQETFFKGATFLFLKEYEADSLNTQQLQALDLFRLANMSLWIIKPFMIAFDQYIHLNWAFNSWDIVQSGPVSPLIAHEKNKNIEFYLTQEDIELAQSLHKSLVTLEKESTIWIAVTTLWSALVEERLEIRFLLLWIVLEAIFGPESGAEVTYRISQRIAFFLAPSNNKDAKDIYDDTRKGYNLRSKVVHGRRSSKIPEQEFQERLWKTEDLVRRALKRILSESDIMKQFSGRDRDDYLDSIVFSS